MEGTPAQLAINGGTPVFPESIGQNLGVRKVGAEEAEAVAALISEGIRGDPIGEFCKAFTQAHGMRHGVAVDSGTAAVHVGVVAAGVEPGDEVILPAISDVGSVKGILAHNAIPIFADVDLQTYNIDPADVESKITDRTKAIVAVHLYGQPAPMDELMDIGRRHGLPIIEDCAQAHFAEYKGRRVGSIGDVSVFSFITGKHMTTITGGMVMTNTDEYAERASLFAVGRGEEEGTKEGVFFRTHVGLGLNYRMNPLGAAVGMVQLNKLDDIVARRRETGQMLDQLIRDIPGLSPPHIIDGAMHAYWLY
ncbi:MAG: DegT/DnrJ/EryC1/StrS family aminotransferase, partial [Caldilineaceae bacterium SB0670_bin_27]|nr:DegT/DnrJ/EryC1/StrS family aminotransferase [Caldilineaceae bacterium SB0670_bin_27]